MLLNTRRRALGLIGAFAGSPLLLPIKAGAKTEDCFASQAFGPWKAQASNAQAGARMDDVSFEPQPEPADLQVQVQIGANFDGKIVIFGDPDQTPLPKNVLIKPDNRLLLRTSDGKTVVDEPLCGNCTEIHDNKVSIVLPLACSSWLRSEPSVEMGIKLGASETRFKLDCETLRKALDWASQSRDELAKKFEAQGCTPPQNCFITGACCEALGLGDDCFELRALRRYRDSVLARTPAGRAAIADYYAFAPAILQAMPSNSRRRRLVSIYFRFILPSALAAKLRLDRLAYRLYAGMMRKLAAELDGIGSRAFAAHASPQSGRSRAPVQSYDPGQRQ